MEKDNTQLQNQEDKYLHLKQQFQTITINNMTTLKIQKGSSPLSVQNEAQLLSNATLSSKQLLITQQLYSQFFQKIIPHIISSKSIIFRYRGLNKRNILEQIGQIQFYNLKYLILTYCQIQNIESIQLLRMQNMRCLHLASNNVVNVKSLIKCFGNTSIFQLNLDRNRIVLANDRQWIRKLNFDQKTQVDFGFIQVKDEFANQDFTYLLPFQLANNKNLKNINLVKFNRIIQQKLFQMMHKIFPHTNLQKVRSQWSANLLKLRYLQKIYRLKNIQKQ